MFGISLNIVITYSLIATVTYIAVILNDFKRNKRQGPDVKLLTLNTHNLIANSSQ